MIDGRMTGKYHFAPRRVTIAALIFVAALVSNSWHRNMASQAIAGVLLIALGIWLGIWLSGGLMRPTPDDLPQRTHGP